MPSKSPAQARLMAAIAHGWKKPGGGGPDVATAREFNQADKGSSTLSEGAKGAGPQPASYARGGAVLERSGDWKKTVPNRGFLNSKDRFTGHRNTTADQATEEDWSKSGGPRGNLKPYDKTESPVKPRS